LCTRSEKWSENRSSRFEPKILLISFSRGSGPPLIWVLATNERKKETLSVFNKNSTLKVKTLLSKIQAARGGRAKLPPTALSVASESMPIMMATRFERS